MADKTNGGVSFNAPIAGNANVNAADGMFVAGDHKTTNIEGGVAGDVVENQNKTDIAGDMHGDLSQSMIVASGPVAEFFNAMREEFNKLDSDELDLNENAFPAFPASIIEQANANAMVLPEPSLEYMEHSSSLSGVQLMSAFEAEAALPDDEQDPGWIAAIVHQTKRFAPIIARAAMSGGEAWLQSTMKSSGAVSASIAFISAIRQGITPDPHSGGNQSDKSW